jgi:glycosyltransferase involved in cell wall biosynthesis
MSSLSIVHLFTHSAVTRGGAVQGMLLARAFQQRGDRVVLFFHAPYGHRGDEASGSFQPFAEAGFDIRWINMKNPLSYLRLRRWLRHERVDILHAHRNLALLFAYFATLGLSRPALVVTRGTTYRLSNPLVKHVFHARRLRHIIAVAQAVKDALVADDGVDQKKISVIYGSFDAQRFFPGRSGKAAREALGVAPGTPLVVCPAAIDSRKGLEFLIQAAKEVVSKFCLATFLIVGSIDDPAYFRRLQAEVDELGVREHVRFTGYRTDVPDILAAADVTVNASTAGEGLTGALREALAMQKPVVCTAVCGNPEAIQDRDSGWVVQPGDARALARAILEALEHPDEARRRATKGYLWVRHHCAIDRRYEQVKRLYHSLT